MEATRRQTHYTPLLEAGYVMSWVILDMVNPAMQPKPYEGFTYVIFDHSYSTISHGTAVRRINMLFPAAPHTKKLLQQVSSRLTTCFGMKWSLRVFTAQCIRDKY